MSDPTDHLDWWNNIRHGGMLLDRNRLSELVAEPCEPLSTFQQEHLRRKLGQFVDSPDAHRSKLTGWVMESLCGFHGHLGEWSRGPQVSKDWSRKAITGEIIRPQQLWLGPRDSQVPVFVSNDARLGIGKGKKVVSQALQWLRQTNLHLAIVTNGFEWRLIFAGLDYEAFCQWHIDQWFSEGEQTAELNGLRCLISSDLWTKPAANRQPKLLQAVNDSRKGQAELSQVLGERVRKAAERLIQGHSTVLNQHADNLNPADTYRAAVRIIMRMVVVLFAESRDALLPRDNPVYHDGYSLQGLRDMLERLSEHRLCTSHSAWPRIVSLFRLVHEGSSHEALPVPTYGGQLFEPGDPESQDRVSRAVHVMEQGCFHADVMTDFQVRAILDLLTRTKIKIRQVRQSTWVPSPVDFSSLDSEYIGILYEGLLDFELRQAAPENPIIFLAVGDQPALPLSTLEAMTDKALENLLDKMKDSSSDDADEEDDAEEETDEEESDDAAADEEDEADSDDDGDEADDERQTMRARAEAWAERAIKVGKLVSKPRGKMTEEKKLTWQAAIDRKARQIVTQIILPGEWYLVRWGGTRKGSGTFYTRPQLAVPTVHRTLRPLAYDPPKKLPLPEGEGRGEGESSEVETTAAGDSVAHNEDAPIEEWIPKRPEEILNLKVCDPACGSGSFPLAALRFLTEALYASLHYHERFQYFADRTIIDLIKDDAGEQSLSDEKLPCRPEDSDFEPRTKAVLRRYIVERCIYGVDLDPLAVELCRLSLWIETLDPRLPFTFLDHKIKCGNSLIGTWFDQFMHYPAMAWMREGGDKNHSNGVHFEKEAWTKAIKANVADVKKELKDYIDEARLIYKVDLTTIETIHDATEQALQEIHQLGIHQADERAVRYTELRQSPEFRDMKFAFDLWCAIWFWPADHIDECPLPLDFYEHKLSDKANEIVARVAAERCFFHWELEFPDVFNQRTQGFDAVQGNPPWDIAKPNSVEFFSSADPLYRSYGKTEAVRKQSEYFALRPQNEHAWLTYNAVFRAQSNWVKHVGSPFGAQINTDTKGKQTNEFAIGDRGRRSFATSDARHSKWRQKREELTGYADADHPFRLQGGADLNLYKMFVETMLVLRRPTGRIGVLLPSSIHNDKGAQALRTAFFPNLELLITFDNEKGIFSGLEHNLKFDVLVIGSSEVRRHHFDYRFFAWKDASVLEALHGQLVQLTVDFVSLVSPTSLSMPEVSSEFERAILEKMYSNGSLLGDEFRPVSEFHLTNDLKHFKGGHEIPVYQGAMIWHHDHRYNMFNDETQNWLRGKHEPVELRPHYYIYPKRWTTIAAYKKKFGTNRVVNGRQAFAYNRIAYRVQSNRANQRTFVATIIPAGSATGNSLSSFICDSNCRLLESLCYLTSFAFDFNVRTKVSGNINNFYIPQFVFPSAERVENSRSRLIKNTLRLVCTSDLMADLYKATMEELGEWDGQELSPSFAALTPHERLRIRCINDAIIFEAFGIAFEQVRHIVLDFRGVDRREKQVLRQPIVALAAFKDLQDCISRCGSRDSGLTSFLGQTSDDGWQLPESLRLSDYGLCDTPQTTEPQVVRECFGPKFFDWQLGTVVPSESWEESQIQSGNILGAEGHSHLQAEACEIDESPAPAKTKFQQQSTLFE